MSQWIFRRGFCEVTIFTGNVCVYQLETEFVCFDELFAFDAEGMFFEGGCELLDGFLVEGAEAALTVGDESSVTHTRGIIKESFAHFTPLGHFRSFSMSKSKGDIMAIVHQIPKNNGYFFGVMLSVAIKGDNVIVSFLEGILESFFYGDSFSSVNGM